MNEYPAAPPAAAERLSFFNVMLKAYSGPSTVNFRRLARNPEASVGKAYLWVAVAAVVSSVISTLMLLIFPTNFMLDYLYQFGGELGWNMNLMPTIRSVGSVAISLLCGAPLAAVFGVIGFAIVSGVLHLIATLLGGKGNYEQLAFLLAAISVPFTLVSSLISMIPYLGCVVFLLSLYLIVLEALAIEGVHQFGIGKAIITLLIPLAAIFLLTLCLAAAVVALLVPVIRESTLVLILLPLV